MEFEGFFKIKSAINSDVNQSDIGIILKKIYEKLEIIEDKINKMEEKNIHDDKPVIIPQNDSEDSNDIHNDSEDSNDIDESDEKSNNSDLDDDISEETQEIYDETPKSHPAKIIKKYSSEIDSSNDSASDDRSHQKNYNSDFSEFTQQVYKKMNGLYGMSASSFVKYLKEFAEQYGESHDKPHQKYSDESDDSATSDQSYQKHSEEDDKIYEAKKPCLPTKMPTFCRKKYRDETDSDDDSMSDDQSSQKHPTKSGIKDFLFEMADSCEDPIGKHILNLENRRIFEKNLNLIEKMKKKYKHN